MTGEPYDIDGNDKPAAPRGSPSAGDPVSKPRPSDVSPSPASGGAVGGDDKPGKGKIDAPKLLDGFEEDADFDKDPELDRIITGKDKNPKTAQPSSTQTEDFVKPGLGNAKVWMVVGTVLLVTALIATGFNADQPRFARVMVLLYNTLLHSGTGVVALFIAATLLKMKLGSFELAASRMFAAVSAFAVMIAFRLSLFNIQWLDTILVLILATAAYGLLVCTLFGLWKKEPLAYVVGSHFFLWLIVAVGTELAKYVAHYAPVAHAVPK